MATTHYRCQMALENIQIQTNEKKIIKKTPHKIKGGGSQHLESFHPMEKKKEGEGKKETPITPPPEESQS